MPDSALDCILIAEDERKIELDEKRLDRKSIAKGKNLLLLPCFLSEFL
jgi:hypothetical protein